MCRWSTLTCWLIMALYTSLRACCPLPTSLYNNSYSHVANWALSPQVSIMMTIIVCPPFFFQNVDNIVHVWPVAALLSCNLLKNTDQSRNRMAPPTRATVNLLSGRVKRVNFCHTHGPGLCDWRFCRTLRDCRLTVFIFQFFLSNIRLVNNKRNCTIGCVFIMLFKEK